ncbi:MAG: hypothetical protein F4Y20_10510 [Acidobacteria bacterium]|nr:hypothetical protein [Acidobacteriota bacterium]MYH21846.1 hypothetical protein [Acidobacteriota bacterium]MYK79663.1 hypothetical protein [Acidobacteriota bacterium]
MTWDREAQRSVRTDIRWRIGGTVLLLIWLASLGCDWAFWMVVGGQGIMGLLLGFRQFLGLSAEGG